MNKVTVIITRSDTKTDKRGRYGKLIFGYDRGEKYKEEDSGTQSASKKCGCPFKIRSTLSKDGFGWKIDVKCGLHNHGLPDRFEGHAFVGRLNAYEQQHIVGLRKRHVPPRHILLSLQEQDIENVTRSRQLYKHKVDYAFLFWFHINKNVKSECVEYVVNDMREPIKKMWSELVRASDEVEYHQRLQ
ncbi:uncharacterized protein LOC131619629 [Vicia villosa]|uniref:uncharacterized protein LOC131619629 n=1 Tax=Vicia villosa TaxID=3911 RepID=UPI00273B1551|nr:uncharacterized protein LOC131619629 [Vicia villosa]